MKPILKKEVKLKNGVKLAQDNALENRRARASRVPRNRVVSASKNKQYKALRKRMYA